MSVLLFEIETLRLRPSSRKSTFEEMFPTNLVPVFDGARVDEHVNWRWMFGEGVDRWVGFGEHSSDGLGDMVIKGGTRFDICEG